MSSLRKGAAKGIPCGKAPPAKPSRRPRTKPVALAAGKCGKTTALQSALLAHGAEPAMILVILALMGASGTVRIRRSRPEVFGKDGLAPAVRAVFETYRPRFDGCLDEAASAEAGLRLRYWEADCQTKAFQVLCGFKPCEMHELFAAFVASNLTNCSSFNAAKGDAPLAVALAKEIGADTTEAWRHSS